jgi:hypothetical protein
MKLTLRGWGGGVTGESRLIVPQYEENPCSSLPLSLPQVSPSLSPTTLQQYIIVQIVVKFSTSSRQPEVHYRIHSVPSTSIFSSVTQSISPLLDIHGGTTLTSASTCYNWSRHFGVYNYKLIRRSHFSKACHLPHPSRSQDPCYLLRQSRPRISLTGPQLLSQFCVVITLSF